MDLHSNLFHSRKEKSKRGIASAGSLIAHAILLVTFITLSATTVSNISAEKPMRAFIAHGAAPPPPPPPPPPPLAASRATPQPVHIETPKIITPTFVQPRQIPTEIPKVDIPVTATAPVDPTPASLPTTGGVPGGQPGGVPGGVVGGVTGGTVGGEIGGQIGGQLGGEKGGVVGGTVGGTGTGTGDAPPAPPAPEVPSGPLHVGGDVKAPVVLSRVQPGYTETARKAHITGVVVLEAIINKS